MRRQYVSIFDLQHMHNRCIQVYIHGAMRSHSVRVLRPFLTLVFVLLALLGGLTEFSRCDSHWLDVVVGFVVGVAMATYLVSISWLIVEI